MKQTLLACTMLVTVPAWTATTASDFDPLFDRSANCGATAGRPRVLEALLLAQAETRPISPSAAQASKAVGPAAEKPPPLWENLGTLQLRITSKSSRARRYFNQGLRLSFAFNHAEAARAFRAAQKLDPDCAMCYWGEALVLGPNINAPMFPEAQAPAVAAAKRAAQLSSRASELERALIAAVNQRYSADPNAERAKLDAAYADAMAAAARRFPREDTVQVLYAEALMDLQPWDYWQAGGATPKGRGAEIVATLERTLKRDPRHPGAIHLYIHALEASTRAQRALPYARRLAGFMPGAGHLVHMPAHIYYRIGMYRESLAANRAAIAADERYFKESPSDPLYKGAYYTHNIHFLMVSAQMGGDAKTALEAAAKLDGALPADFLRLAAVAQPVKAAVYTTHAQFSDAATILALPDPGDEFVLVKAMWHYARALAQIERRDAAAAGREIDALAALESGADFKPLADWQVPAREVVQIARHVARGRLAAASKDLDGAIRAFEEAVFVEDTIAYMEPPYWYYPVRQSLGAALLRAGRTQEAEKALRDSLARVPNNGWALYALRQLYAKTGDTKTTKATVEAFNRAWLGDRARLDLMKL
ncbi:MAG TPA: hypothetical protein VFR86_18625 [Burkholderiaceae bacterium]|nr:hypothetical protein [Burkholderiaceae bacterium]